MLIKGVLIKMDKADELLTSQGPFGDSDGTRANIKEIIKGFINFTEFRGFSGLSFQENDRAKRIIIGKKGSGKTIYLRRIHNLFLDDDSVYVSEISYDPPKTRLIIKISEWSTVNQVSELWTDIWKAAILRTVFTHLFYSERLKGSISSSYKKNFLETYKKILPKNKKAISIYSQVKDICSSYNSSNELYKYLDNSLWDDFEIDLGELINNSNPLFFFVDAVDEDYSHAPLHWLRCQKGLFYAVYRLLRNQSFGGRLHISICIRETVLAHVFEGEHLSRYINDTRIKKLDWNKNSIFHFFDKKIEKLADHLFLGDISTKGKNIYTLLGFEKIKIQRSGKEYEEDIKDYIIRHTRLLPRDVVNIGNEICRSISEQKQQNHTKIDGINLLRSSIHICSKAIAIETIAWCANQQTSNWMYNGAFDHNIDTLYTSDQEMTKGVTNFFRLLIADINIDRFSYDTIISTLENVETFGFDKSDNPFDILWQFGLIGYLDLTGEMANKEIFFNEISPEGFKLPLNRDQYVFHSCLIDLINIEPKDSPVYV